MLEGTYRFESTNAFKKFIGVMDTPPLSVAYDVYTGLFLKSNREPDHIIHELFQFLTIHAFPVFQHMLQELRSRQGTDDVGIQERKLSGLFSLHKAPL